MFIITVMAHISMRLLNLQSNTQLPTNSLIEANSLFNTFYIAIVVFALFLAFITYLQQPKRKAIAWELVSDEMLLKVGSSVRNRVQILLDNKPVSDLCLTVIKVWNSGNAPIQSADFQRPLRFDFGGAEVLDAEILETTSEKVKKEAKASLKRTKRSVMFEPLLLNSKDTITLKVLLTKHTSRLVKANVQISGLNRIQARTSVLETERKNLLIWSVVFVLGGQGLGYLLQWYLFPIFNKPGLSFVIVHYTVLFLKNLAAGVILFYALVFRASARGGTIKIKTIRGVIAFWVISSAVTSMFFVPVFLQV